MQISPKFVPSPDPLNFRPKSPIIYPHQQFSVFFLSLYQQFLKRGTHQSHSPASEKHRWLNPTLHLTYWGSQTQSMSITPAPPSMPHQTGSPFIQLPWPETFRSLSMTLYLINPSWSFCPFYFLNITQICLLLAPLPYFLKLQLLLVWWPLNWSAHNYSCLL